jgi:hypothetical protein
MEDEVGTATIAVIIAFLASSLRSLSSLGLFDELGSKRSFYLRRSDPHNEGSW